MSSSTKTHLDRTQASSRNNIVSDVVVTDIHRLSPTVKDFTLRVENNLLNFKAGQWVDLHIPNVDTVGGYSFTSPPHQLADQGTIKLAIQHNQQQPTLWMSTRCKVGDKLSIQVGGDFFYAPPTISDVRDLLLIGGGVGINPLFSMIQHHAWLLQTGVQSSSSSESLDSDRPRGRVQLLHSAKTKDELLFKDCIDKLQSQCSTLNVTYFVTKESVCSGNYKSERLTEVDIRHALSLLDASVVQCYICGPPPMTEHVLEILTENCRIDKDRILYEKWW